MGGHAQNRSDGGAVSSRPLVLLVEDDVDLLEMAELVLQNEGFPVVTATSGRRALSRLEVVEPALIITDMMMPELDGLAFIEEYTHTSGHHAPIVAVSSFPGYLDSAKQLGAVRTLAKPYHPQQLVDVALDVLSDEAAAHEATAEPEQTDEDARLRALLDLHLDEAAPELELERFLDEVAALYNVPVAGISAVTRDKQQLLVQCSTTDPDTGGPREHSFCTHAVAARSALVIQDATQNPFFCDNPSVTERGFRFYAGVPLMARHGESVGTLCILDFEPHAFTYVDLELLGVLAQRVLAAFDLQHHHEHPEAESCYRYLHCLDDQLGIYSKALFSDLVVLEATRAMQSGEQAALVGVSVVSDQLELVANRFRDAVTGGLVGRIGPSRLAAVVRGASAAEARELARQCAPHACQISATDLDRYEGASGQALLRIEQALTSNSDDAEAPRPYAH